MKPYLENKNLIDTNEINSKHIYDKQRLETKKTKSNLKFKINNSSPSKKKDKITIENTNTNTNSTSKHNIFFKKSLINSGYRKLWIKIKLEKWFQITKRNTNIEKEIYCGIIQFISCLYVLAVIPIQMNSVGYKENVMIITICITCCIGNIIASFVTNLPFILAPSTAVSIFLAASLKQEGLHKAAGNSIVIMSGISLAFIGIIPHISRFILRLVPDCINKSTTVGIGLITALAGATELNLIVRGENTIVDMGPLTMEILVAFAALIVVSVSLHFHIKFAFCNGLVFGTLIMWWLTGDYPRTVINYNIPIELSIGNAFEESGIFHVSNLLFLYIITLNGLANNMANLAGICSDSSDNNSRTRTSFEKLFIVCGFATILSGYMTGPPILISPESIAGIKAGSRTGLSTFICGLLFGIATIFYPLFSSIPAAGSAPLLFLVGIALFKSCIDINWNNPSEAVPAYLCLFFIPFTYSILRGVAIGFLIYILIGCFTGDFIRNSVDFIDSFSDDLLPTASTNNSNETIEIEF